MQGSIREIPEEDFRLIESEMRKVITERKPEAAASAEIPTKTKKTEDDYDKAIIALPLSTKSLHDRLAEMLEQVGSWMDYNTQTRHKITPDHSYELDVAWLSGKNPEVAIEVQISGNITEAKDRLAQARKFNYRKVIMVLRETDPKRLNSLMKFEPDLRSWMEAWSIGAVYEMYSAGEGFFKYYRQLIEAIYKDKKESGTCPIDALTIHSDGRANVVGLLNSLQCAASRVGCGDQGNRIVRGPFSRAMRFASLTASLYVAPRGT